MISNKHGFTLIELLMVLSILSILIATTTSSLIAYIPRSHLKEASRTIASICQLAKIEAIKRNSRTAVVFSTTQETASLYIDSGDGNWNTEGDNTLMKQFVLSNIGSNIIFGHGKATSNISGNSFSSDLPVDLHFEFSGRGFLKSSSENDEDNTVYIQNNAGNSMAITVHASGGITTKEWGQNAWQ